MDGDVGSTAFKNPCLFTLAFEIAIKVWVGEAKGKQSLQREWFVARLCFQSSKPTVNHIKPEMVLVALRNCLQAWRAPWRGEKCIAVTGHGVRSLGFAFILQLSLLGRIKFLIFALLGSK